jgi:hypothetical protein
MPSILRAEARSFAGRAAMAALAAIALCMSACAPSYRRISDPKPDAPPRFQIIYVIHGDGGYIYHDTSGVRHLADTDALDQALYVATASLGAETFIFHQKSRRHWFHGAADGVLYQYRNGKLLRKEEYLRAAGGDFAAESALLHRYESPVLPADCAEPDSLGHCGRILLYFGHEIPATEIKGYSRSRPDVPFSLSSFAQGLERFAGPDFTNRKPFSLIVLSTCNGGTPVATRMIAPYASYLLASPGELHLSFFDTRALAELTTEAASSQPQPQRAWGARIAGDSFAKLRATTRTAVTLALYETDSASAYLEAHRGAWDGTGLQVNLQANGKLPGPGNTGVTPYRDCGEIASFGNGGHEAGAATFYRPPRFGRDKEKTGISGWECPGN